MPIELKIKHNTNKIQWPEEWRWTITDIARRPVSRWPCHVCPPHAFDSSLKTYQITIEIQLRGRMYNCIRWVTEMKLYIHCPFNSNVGCFLSFWSMDYFGLKLFATNECKHSLIWFLQLLFRPHTAVSQFKIKMGLWLIFPQDLLTS